MSKLLCRLACRVLSPRLKGQSNPWSLARKFCSTTPPLDISDQEQSVATSYHSESDEEYEIPITSYSESDEEFITSYHSKFDEKFQISTLAPMSCEYWDFIRREAKERAFELGSFFSDEAIYGLRRDNKATMDDIKRELQSLNALTIKGTIGKPIKTCALLVDVDFAEQQMKCWYYLALQEESRHEKLCLDYLVKEFKHWEWNDGWLDNDEMSSILEFLARKFPFRSDLPASRGLYLHKSRIPLDYVCKPLTQELKDALLAKINMAYQQMDTLIPQIRTPDLMSMFSKINSVDGFPPAKLERIAAN